MGFWNKVKNATGKAADWVGDKVSAGASAAADIVVAPFENLGDTFDQASSVRAGSNGIGPTADTKGSQTRTAVSDAAVATGSWASDVAAGMNPYPGLSAAVNPTNPAAVEAATENSDRFGHALGTVGEPVLETAEHAGKSAVVLGDEAFDALHFDDILECLYTRPGPDGTLHTPDLNTRPDHTPLEIGMAAVEIASYAFPAATAAERLAATTAGRRAIADALANGATSEQAVIAGQRATRDYLAPPRSFAELEAPGTSGPSELPLGTNPKPVQPGAVAAADGKPALAPDEAVQTNLGAGTPRSASVGSPEVPPRDPRYDDWIAQADAGLVKAGINPSDVYGDLPATDRWRMELAKQMGTNRFSDKLPGMDIRAYQFAFNNGGKGNAANFKNLYEYYKARFDLAAKEVDPSVPKRQRPQIAASEMDDAVVAAELASDLEFVRSSPRGVIELDPALVPLGSQRSDLANAIQAADNLGFGNPNSVVMHTYKHPEVIELGGSGKIDVAEYIDGAARTVREGALVDVAKADNGSLSFIYHRNILTPTGDTKTVEAIVIVSTDGKARIASYGSPKAVKNPIPGSRWRWNDETPPELAEDIGQSTTSGVGGPAGGGVTEAPRLGLPWLEGLGSLRGREIPNGQENVGLADMHWSNGLIESITSGLDALLAPMVPVGQETEMPVAETSRRNQSMTVNIISPILAGFGIDSQEIAATFGAGVHIK
ncbi:hypothetical protein [Nocardia sp. NPDC052566]|uniref:hypothetical protein n=1 Tax=Nocardia sp. NPDC052566 TaxID=3364330 RepID=UPI0037C8C776